MSQNVWATIMPFGPVTLIFYWPKKIFSGHPKAGPHFNHWLWEWWLFSMHICTIILCHQYVTSQKYYFVQMPHSTDSFLSVNIQQNYPILKVSNSRWIVNTDLQNICKNKNNWKWKRYFTSTMSNFQQKSWTIHSKKISHLFLFLLLVPKI
jgi:hypothetical protein